MLGNGERQRRAETATYEVLRRLLRQSASGRRYVSAIFATKQIAELGAALRVVAIMRIAIIRDHCALESRQV
jgi:hypothetical protein